MLLRIISYSLLILILNANYTLSFWEQTGGPEGGEIRSIAVNRDTIFAGSFWGGLFRSTNKGKSWKIVAFQDERINQIKILKNKIYVATGDERKKGGLFLSTNNGNSWEKLLDKTVVSFDILENTIIASTLSSELLISPYQGKTWINLNFPGGLVYTILFREDKIILGTENNGIFISTDLGENWIPRNNGLNCLIVWCITQKDSTIFIGTGGGGIFSSTDFGENWVARNSGILHPYVLTINFVDTIAFAGTVGGGLYMSLNYGRLWFKTNLSYESIMSFDTDGKNIFVGTKGSGIYYSSNLGDSWIEINSGIKKSEILCLEAIGNTIYAGTNGGGLHYTTNWGKNWVRTAYSIRNPYISSIAFKDTTIYVGTLGSGLFFKTKSIEDWKQSILKTYEITAILPFDNLLLVGTNHYGLFVMNISADSIFYNKFHGESITGICKFNDNVFVSLKSGGIAIFSYPNFQNEIVKLKHIPITTIHSSDFGIIAGSDNGNLYLSTDYGNNWQIIASNNNGYVHSIKSQNNFIIASWILNDKSSWVISSQDQGKTWGIRTEGLEGKTITSFAFADTLIFSGTLGFGVYKSNFKEIFSGIDEIHSKSQFEFEIYPNPAKEEIKISSENFRNETQYKVQIISIFGQIVNYEIDAVNNRIKISDLPRGVYIVQIERKYKILLKI